MCVAALGAPGLAQCLPAGLAALAVLMVPTGLVAGLPCGFTAGLAPGAGLAAGLAFGAAAFEADDEFDELDVVVAFEPEVLDVDVAALDVVEVLVLDVLVLAGTLVRPDQQLLLAAQGEVPIWL